MRTKEPPRDEAGRLRQDFVTEFPLDDVGVEALASVELLDFGSGTGESLADAERRFGVRGLGIDNSPHKVRRARRRGFDVRCADVLELSRYDLGSVRYVNLDNVLEHMPTLALAEDMLAQACRVASRCVHVRHPSFEETDYLAALGVKLYWTDWPTAHSAPIRLHQFVEMAERIGVYRFLVQPVMKIGSSDDHGVLPLSAPPDQQRQGKASPVEAGGRGKGVYSLDRHGPKPTVRFDRPVYFAFDIVFVTGPEMPTLDYPADPEAHVARPRFRWPSDAATDNGQAAVATEIGDEGGDAAQPPAERIEATS